ncbi:hypothetical protein [Paralcaligenes ureilyticus]|uniref:Uncharacterized protein n=1 Tax=Paralcaligenes ureilyticus TaxID=627131 RepID=A0A4R3LR56_9BURK|nr:hypothetical protein [Paralcaligenes ureilyticus]TCT03064.1 hypothetical protein EDC26_11631 [Paralcaligenes ureilyticus]
MSAAPSHKLMLALCSPFMVAVAWYGVAHVVDQPELVPDPYAVLKKFIELARAGVIASAIGRSLSRVAIGFAFVALVSAELAS